MARSVEGGGPMRDDEPGTLSDVRDTVGVDSTLPQIHSVRPVETALPHMPDIEQGAGAGEYNHADRQKVGVRAQIHNIANAEAA